MANRVVELLDEKIRQLEARLAGLRAFRPMVAEDPAVVIELQELLLDPEANGALNIERATTAREPGLPKHERIREFMLSKGNEWLSLRQIAAGTQISRNTVRGILYQSPHSPIFESKKTSDSRTFWRLKEDGGEACFWPCRRTRSPAQGHRAVRHRRQGDRATYAVRGTTPTEIEVRSVLTRCSILYTTTHRIQA